jgi:hypothetical protein
VQLISTAGELTTKVSLAATSEGIVAHFCSLLVSMQAAHQLQGVPES